MQGLFDTCSLLKSVPVDDGNGGVEDGTVVVVQTLACRRSNLSGELRHQRVGVGGSATWRFSTEVIPDLPSKEGDLDILYVISYDGELYDVVWWQYRIVESNIPDHIEFRTKTR